MSHVPWYVAARDLLVLCILGWLALAGFAWIVYEVLP